MPFSKALQEEVNATSIGHLTRKKHHVIHINTDTSAFDALQVMAKHHIGSVVVKNAEYDTFVGIVSVSDIMAYIAFGLVERKVENGAASFVDVDLSVNAEEKLKSRKAFDLINLTEEGRSGNTPAMNGIFVYNDVNSLRQICEAFHKGVHRVIVRCEPTFFHPSVFYRLLTQTDIAKLLLKQLKKHAPETTVGDIWEEKTKPKMVTVGPSETALDGYRRMLTHSLSALPVVDGTGMVVGTLSVSDLKLVDELMCISMPVTAFLKHIHGTERLALAHYATTDAPLTEVLEHLLSCHYHRTWIVEDNKLAGVLTLSDMAKALFNEPEK